MSAKMDETFVVRVTRETKDAMEAAAQSAGVPTHTWIRDQITASLYLGGVASAPQVIYEGFRYSIQDVTDNIEEITMAVRAWPELLERIMTTSMIAGGLAPAESADRAEEMVLDALKATLYKPAEGDEG